MPQLPMKVMLVDDERLAVEDLLTLIPWQEHGCEVVATAPNGRRALELFERWEPDLMIVDVCMPMMDGLELLHQLSIRYRDKFPKIILLTAYKDFDYAKKAIEYRVSNYLLKHTLNGAALVKEIEKVRSEWESQQKYAKMIQKQSLKHWMVGNTSVPPSESRLFEATRSAGLIVFEKDRSFSLMPLAREEEASVSETFFETIDWGFLGRRQQVEVVEGNHGQWCLVFPFEGTRSQRLVHETLQHAASYVLKRYMNSHRSTLSAATAYSFGKKLLPELYREAADALRYKWFVGKGVFIDAAQIRSRIDRTGPGGGDAGEELKAIAYYVRHHDSDKLEQSIRRLFQIIKEPYWNLRGLCESVNGLSELLLKLTGHGLAEHGLYDVNDIRDWFIERFGSLSKVPGSPRYSHKTNQAIKYILAHYHEDLDARTVSDALNISSSYLHQLFKKEVGQTFLEFLTNYRIKVAQELLTRDEYKIYEIAEITGYKSGQYFSQVFQRVTGTSPQLYKNQIADSAHYENQF